MNDDQIYGRLCDEDDTGNFYLALFGLTGYFKNKKSERRPKALLPIGVRYSE